MSSPLVLVLVAGLLQPAAPPTGDAALAARLQAQVDALAASGSFAGAVLLAKGDQVLLRQAWGLASRETGAPNTPETRFNLGSINKAFTRLAIEKLAREGRLSLADTLDRYVPEYPAEQARKITVQHLLEHRAGTGPVFGPRYDAADRTKLLALRDWLPLVVEPLRFEPGTREEYSNAGYILLGLIIEKVTGQSYYDYVRANVFVPAGMKDSGSPANDGLTPGVATGYTTRGGGSPRPNRELLPGRGSSAGGGYSTLDDLFRFAQALRAGRLGPAPGGMGIAGGAPGLNAALEMAGDYTLVVLANLDPPAAESVAAQARELLPATDAGPRRRVRMGGGPQALDGRGPGRPERTLLTAAVEVPMLTRGHLPAVEVKVNGQGPFMFAIDTGAAGTARVSSPLAERLGLPTVGEAMSGDPSGRNPRRVPLVRVDSLELGTARFEGLAAGVRDAGEPALEGVDGILGFGLFAEGLLTLDYPQRTVRFAPGELPPANGRDVIAFEAGDHGLPTITITVAGREMKAHVDAGAMGGLILPEAEAAALPLAGPTRVVGRARTTSNEFEIKAAELAGEAAIGGYVLKSPTIEFQPFFPMANVGAKVLRDLAVTFDQRNARLRLVPATKAVAP